MNLLIRIAQRIAARSSGDAHQQSIALMKFLARTVNSLGVGPHTYVVGGAVRNFVINQPIKDIDLVIDSINAQHDSAWLAEQISKEISKEI